MTSTLKNTPKRSPRIFEASNFKTTKDWIYFCLEFDLSVCGGCRCRARKRDSEVTDWFCDSCEPPIHPDLWKVIQSRQNVRTQCDLCGEQVEVKDCWVSDDCRRLYCATHLEPLKVEDRYRMARQYLQRWFGHRGARRVGVERRSRIGRPAESGGVNTVTGPGGTRRIAIDDTDVPLRATEDRRPRIQI